MKKHGSRRVHHRPAARHRVGSGQTGEQYLMVVRGWMLVVTFALMLGVGVIVGNYVNQELEVANPAVAGASTEQ